MQIFILFHLGNDIISQREEKRRKNGFLAVTFLRLSCYIRIIMLQIQEIL